MAQCVVDGLIQVLRRPYAPILIQEVIAPTNSGGGIDVMQRSMQIHASITELIPAALSSIGIAV